MTTAFLQNAYEETRTVPKCMCYIFSEAGCPSKLGQPHETRLQTTVMQLRHC